MSDCWRPDALQQARRPCPSYLPEFAQTHINCRWCHPTISSSVVPFSSCLRSFLASGALPMSRLFASGGQSIGASALASVLPMNIQGWFPLGLTGLLSFCLRDSQEASPIPQFKSINSLMLSLFMVQLSHPYMTTGKTIHRFDYTDLCWQSDASAFNMLSRCVIAFLPGSKHLLISWLQSQSAVILEPKKRKSATTSTFSPSVCHEVDAMILVFCKSSFKPTFSWYYA